MPITGAGTTGGGGGGAEAPDSNAPRSGAVPEYARPTFTPTSINEDPAARCKKLVIGSYRQTVLVRQHLMN